VRRTSCGGSGTGYAAKTELLKLQRRDQFPDEQETRLIDPVVYYESRK
jgi:hypothetical protein